MSHRTPSVWLYAFTLILILAGCPSCSDDPAAPEEPDDSNVSVESSNREVATIGAAGGSVSTTSDAGVTYTLHVPAGALPGDVEIAITPVTAISNLPFEGRLEGAVRLGPSGLQLFMPAVLTIAKAPSTSGTEQLVGFAYEGDADSFEPAAAIDAATEIRIPITHFSGAGAASGAPQEWLSQLCASAPTLDYPFTSQMDVCWQSTVAKRDWFFEFARDYLADAVAPLVGNTGTLATGVREYTEWSSGCEALAEQFEATDWEAVLGSEIVLIEEFITTELVAAVAGEKSALCSQGGIAHLRALFEYQYLANAAGLGETTGLRDEDILDGLCAEVRIPDLTLVDPMPMNQGTSLDARAELWINDQREDGRFKFTVNTNGINVTCGIGQTVCAGNSNGFGEYTGVVTRTGPGLVAIDVFASLLLAIPAGTVNTVVETPLVGSETIERESYSIAATFPTTVEPGTPVTLTAVVTRDNDVGSPQPVEGALVTFDVAGGVADPVAGQTDASGSVSTQVTANDGPNRVVVDIAAAFDGRQVATRTVEAAIEATDPTGTVVLTTRRSVASVGDFRGVEGCSQTGSPFDDYDEFGPSTLNANSSATCHADGETTSIDGTIRVISDTGVAADGHSARMTFDTNMTLSATVTCAEPPCNGDFSSGQGELVVNFTIDSPMMFSFGVTTSGDPPGTVVNYSSAELTGGSLGSIAYWDTSQPNAAVQGTLPAGSYYLRFYAGMNLYADGSGNYSMTGSLRLGAASAAITRDH